VTEREFTPEWMDAEAARHSWDEDWKENKNGYTLRAFGQEGFDLALHFEHTAVFVGRVE
jgi:hypothetical protein